MSPLSERIQNGDHAGKISGVVVNHLINIESNIQLAVEIVKNRHMQNHIVNAGCGFQYWRDDEQQSSCLSYHNSHYKGFFRTRATQENTTFLTSVLSIPLLLTTFVPSVMWKKRLNVDSDHRNL